MQLTPASLNRADIVGFLLSGVVSPTCFDLERLSFMRVTEPNDYVAFQGGECSLRLPEEAKRRLVEEELLPVLLVWITRLPDGCRLSATIVPILSEILQKQAWELRKALCTAFDEVAGQDYEVVLRQASTACPMPALRGIVLQLFSVLNDQVSGN